MEGLKNALKITKVSRQFLNDFLENYSLDQLNYIPSSFSNNIFWNIAHVIVTQQLLVCKLRGLELSIPESWVDKYKKGTIAKSNATAEDLKNLKVLLFKTIEITERDVDLNKFQKTSAYKTSTGFEIKTVNDAFAFNNFHEAIHLGYILALKKEVNNI